jgi:hypothetical protein
MDNSLTLSKVGGHKVIQRQGHEFTLNVDKFLTAEARSGARQKRLKILKFSVYSGNEKYMKTSVSSKRNLKYCLKYDHSLKLLEYHCP